MFTIKKKIKKGKFQEFVHFVLDITKAKEAKQDVTREVKHARLNKELFLSGNVEVLRVCFAKISFLLFGLR